MSTTQCLWYALDRWHKDGGYLQLRRSGHWCVPHVQHVTHDGELSHYVPFGELRLPVMSLFGFAGEVRHDDDVVARPMTVLCMGIGTMILMVLGCVWAIKTWSKELWTRSRNA